MFAYTILMVLQRTLLSHIGDEHNELAFLEIALLIDNYRLVYFVCQDIILVEALKLDNVNTGLYMLHCLPLRLVGAEGSPIRCILIK